MEKALRDSDLEELRRLLDAGGDPNTVSWQNKNTLLIIACLFEDLPIAKLLIEKGADPNKVNEEDGNTPLLIACSRAYFPLVEMLVEKGADLNKENIIGSFPLMVVAKHGDVKPVNLLLEKGADPNKENTRTGNTTLTFACDIGFKDIVELLIEKGADPNKPNGRLGHTPLITACIKNFKLTAEILLNNGADPNKENAKNGKFPLIIAAEYDHAELAKILIEKGADINRESGSGDTALIIACKQRTINTVKVLLDNGADVNQQSKQSGTSALFYACRSRDILIIKMLLAKGADVNQRSSISTETALFHPSEEGLVDVLKVLLENGADPNIASTINKWTPLITASYFGKKDAVNILLKHGADPKHEDVTGLTAYDHAKSDEIREILKAAGPAPPVIPYSGKAISDIEFFDIFLGKIDQTNTEEQAKDTVKNNTFCPVCLGKTERDKGCLYMKHVCDKATRHNDLYIKYKNESGEIWWCVDCGRICSGHAHYAIGLASEGKPKLLPAGSPFAFTCDNSDPRDKDGYVRPDTGTDVPAAKTNNGGGPTEKLKRVARMIDYSFELQHFVGEISDRDAKYELVEETWNSALMRMRFDPQKFKRWKTDLSVFKTSEVTVAEIVPEAVPGPGDIEDPIITEGTDPISLDEGFVIQFKHKNKDGVMFNHVHGDEKMFIGKGSVTEFLKTMGEKLGKCFDDDCGGWWWPQEIAKAFEDPRLEVTDADRAELAKYKERFNRWKAPATGGAAPRWKFNLLSEINNAQCYLPPRKKAGNRTRKNKKSAKKTRSVSKK